MLNKLVIFGVGLIGGSAALALRRAGKVKKIIGVGRNGEPLDDAIKLGVIDATAPAAEAVKQADLILLATPVGQIPNVMVAIAPYLDPHTVITDAGSTKADVAAAARAHLGKHLPRFVPAHPIAGAEKSGVLAARADLFSGKNTVLTQLPETDPHALEKVRQFWQDCGMTVSSMSPELHEEIFAAVSHLPHLLAFALVEGIASRANAEQLFSFAAGGFRDFSRIASSSPEMWRDICLANSDALMQEIDRYQHQLAKLRELIAQGNGDELENLFNHARDARNAWADTHLQNSTPRTPKN